MVTTLRRRRRLLRSPRTDSFESEKYTSKTDRERIVHSFIVIWGLSDSARGADACEISS
jgi:hypothetical protein